MRELKEDSSMKDTAMFFVSITVVSMVFGALLALPQKSPTGLPTKPASGQFTSSEGVVSCPGPRGVFSDSDVRLNLQTTGNPVQISIHMNATMGANTGIAIRPTIDDETADDQTAEQNIAGAESIHIVFSRIYSVAQGRHSFKAQFSCKGNVSVGQRWMIVQELN
jgi:hypothetical protein